MASSASAAVTSSGRPSQQIYRPPVARSKATGCESNGGGGGGGGGGDSSSTASSDILPVHLEQSTVRSVAFAGPKIMSSKSFSAVKSVANGKSSESNSTSGPSKSVLKRSKSFGVNSTDQLLRLLSDLDGIRSHSTSVEHQALVRRALENPKSLVMTQLMEVVMVIVNKALEKCSNAHPMSKLCLSIVEREKGKMMFLESLMNCCREWFNEKDKLLSSPSNKRRWPSYVAFVTELYLALRCKLRHARLVVTKGTDDKSGDSDRQMVLIGKHCRSLSTILFDCCSTLTKAIGSVNCSASDVEALQALLRTVGRFMEEDSRPQMETLMATVREAFITSTASMGSMGQKCLMEIIEFRASKWTFSQSQQLYYFPYTRLVCGDN